MDGRRLLAWLHAVVCVGAAVLALMVAVAALLQEAWAGLAALLCLVLSTPAVLTGLLRLRRGPYRTAAILQAIATFLLLSDGALAPAVVAGLLFAGSAAFASMAPRAATPAPPHP